MMKLSKNAYYWLSLFLVVLAFSPGCSSEPDSPFGSPVKACTLFTHAEIEMLMGAKVDEPAKTTHKVDEQTGYWMSMCNYYAPDVNLSVGIMIRPIAKGKSIDSAFDENVTELTAGMPDYKIETVSGVGAKAFWNAPTGQLTVFEGSYTLIVSGLQPGSAEQEKLAFCKKVSEAVLKKL
jgi:hypothetical protein